MRVPSTPANAEPAGKEMARPACCARTSAAGIGAAVGIRAEEEDVEAEGDADADAVASSVETEICECNTQGTSNASKSESPTLASGEAEPQCFQAVQFRANRSRSRLLLRATVRSLARTPCARKGLPGK